jgi:glycosyltransferase involved in cell wall biosynthesis
MRSILWVTRPDSLQLAGGQQAILQEQLQADGWEVSILPYQHRLLWRERQRGDVLVWTFVPTQLEVWLAKRLARIQVGVIHELSKSDEAIPTLDAWVTPTEALRRELNTRGVPATDVEVVKTTAVMEESTLPSLHAAIEITANTTLIYAGGPVHTSSGHRIAVWALNILNYLRPNVHLVMHGEGVERDRLESFHRSIDGACRVHFLPATWPVAAVIREVSQVWLPMRHDGVPDALLAALQLGKPILASNLPSLKEWIRHGVNGMLVRPDQPAELAGAAHRLFDDPALVESMCQAARAPGIRSGDVSTVLRMVMKRAQTISHRQAQAA